MENPNNTLILALGPVGDSIAQVYEKTLAQRHPNQSVPKIFALRREEPNEKFRLPSLNIQPKAEQTLLDLLSSLYPQHVIPGANASDLLKHLEANHPRLLGQVSLHQHIYAIKQVLREIHDEMTLANQHISVINPNQTHVFVLLSLADEFMSGLMPDLAYVIQNSLKAGASHESMIHIHPILLMPGFEGEIQLNTDDPQQKAEIESRINASAAACLKEIDYYLAQGYSYYHHFMPGLTIDTTYSPLGNGQIYLLEPANEKQYRLKSLDDIKQMVATWLYYVTLTPLQELLNAPTSTPEARYGSFGAATLSVPINRWIERVATQLQLDLLEEWDLSESHISPPDIASTGARLQLTEQDIRHSLTDATEYEQLTMPSSLVTQSPDASEFLKQVQRDYTRIMHEKMPTVREHIFKKMHYETNIRMGQLKDHVHQLLDESRGGTEPTRKFLEALYHLLQQEKKELTVRKEQLERDEQEKLERQNKEQRDAYLNHAQMATRIVPISFIVIGGLSMIVLSSHISQTPIYGVAIFVLGACLAILLWIYTRSTSHTSRSRVIQSYEQRLQASREAVLLSAMLRFYQELIESIGDIGRDVHPLSKKLVEIRRQLNKRQQEKELGDGTRFSGLAMGRICESLLTPQLMTEFEQKAKTEDLEGEIKAMHQEIGTPSQWIEEEWEEQQLANKLEKFAHKRVWQQLRQYDLDQLLKRIPRARLEAKITRMLQVSQPYWQHNRREIRQHQVVALANALNHRELLEHFPLDIKVIPIKNVYELVMITIRHGFTLRQSNTFSHLLMKHYEHLIRTKPDTLHTRADRRILATGAQDASGISMLNHSVRHLCAVALGMKIIFKDDDFYWEDENMQENKLNGTLTDVLFEMARDHDLQAAIRTATLKRYDAKTSPRKLQNLLSSIDFDHPPYAIWAILAIQDFLQYENPLHP